MQGEAFSDRQVVALAHLAKSNRTRVELRRLIGCDSNTAARIVQSILDAGWVVVRGHVATSGRPAQVLAITKSGRQKIREHTATRKQEVRALVKATQERREKQVERKWWLHEFVEDDARVFDEVDPNHVDLIAVEQLITFVSLVREPDEWISLSEVLSHAPASWRELTRSEVIDIARVAWLSFGGINSTFAPAPLPSPAPMYAHKNLWLVTSTDLSRRESLLFTGSKKARETKRNEWIDATKWKMS